VLYVGDDGAVAIAGGVFSGAYGNAAAADDDDGDDDTDRNHCERAEITS